MADPQFRTAYDTNVKKVFQRKPYSSSNLEVGFFQPQNAVLQPTSSRDAQNPDIIP